MMHGGRNAGSEGQRAGRFSEEELRGVSETEKPMWKTERSPESKIIQVIVQILRLEIEQLKS